MDTRKVHPRPLLSLVPLAALALAASGCAGSYGPMKVKTHVAGNTRIVETKNYGFEIHRLADHWGFNLGSRTTLVIAPVTSPAPYRSVFGVRWSPGTVLHMSSVNSGMEANWDPIFRGFTFGRTSRHISALPLNADQAFSLMPSHDSEFGYEVEFHDLDSSFAPLSQ